LAALYAGWLEEWQTGHQCLTIMHIDQSTLK